MNLHLLGSIGQNYPEESDGYLDTGSHAVFSQFNRYGTLLAVGCNDGRIVVYDFITRGVSKVYQAHTHTITCVSWSRDCHKMISSSIDRKVIIWDVFSGEIIHCYSFVSSVTRAQFSPRDPNIAIVTPLSGPELIKIETGEKIDLTKIEKEVFPDEESSTTASFDRRGEYIYTGNGKGRITVIKTSSLKVVASFRVSSGQTNITIRDIEFARKGSSLLVNTTDRVIRVYDGNEVLKHGKNSGVEPFQKISDLVNKSTWKKCCFSGDGEYICGGSSKNNSLFVWEKKTGSLLKTLNGPRGEQLTDVAWHPFRPVLCSISSGIVAVWAQNQVENWSAFAPDFTELDENIEYEERESEFDDEDEDKTDVEEDNVEPEKEEEIEVDIETVDPINAYLSSDEETEDLNALKYIPVAPEVEEPEQTSPQNVTPIGDQMFQGLRPPSPTYEDDIFDDSPPHKKKKRMDKQQIVKSSKQLKKEPIKKK